MISRIILVTAVVSVAASMSLAVPIRTVAMTCMSEPQQEKPKVIDEGVKDTDSFNASFPKMFRAYVQKDQDGETLYQPLVLTPPIEGINYGESLSDETKPAVWDQVFYADCAIIRFSVTKMRQEVAIVYALKDMVFYFGDNGAESCKLVKIEAEEEGTQAYAALGGPRNDQKIATLVIQRMDLHKVLHTELPEKYEVRWK